MPRGFSVISIHIFVGLNAFQCAVNIFLQICVIDLKTAFFIVPGRFKERCGHVRQCRQKTAGRADIAGFFRRRLSESRVDERSDLLMDRRIFLRQIIIVFCIRIEVLHFSQKTRDLKDDRPARHFDAAAFQRFIGNRCRKHVIQLSMPEDHSNSGSAGSGSYLSGRLHYAAEEDASGLHFSSVRTDDKLRSVRRLCTDHP